MANETFLPEDYQVPSSGGGYTELKDGENRFRILSAPLLLWIVWENGKCTRIAYKGKESKPPKPTTTVKDNVKHGWAVIVWNYSTKCIEIFEIDKQTIISALEKLSKDSDWGHPKHYDIKVTRKGSGMDTEYSLIPGARTEPSDEIVEAYVATPIDLSKLLVPNGDPFIKGAGDTASTQPATAKEKVVTPDNWTPGDAVPAGYKEDNGKLVKKKLPF